MEQDKKKKNLLVLDVAPDGDRLSHDRLGSRAAWCCIFPPPVTVLMSLNPTTEATKEIIHVPVNSLRIIIWIFNRPVVLTSYIYRNYFRYHDI